MKTLACLLVMAIVGGSTRPLGPTDYYPPFTTARAAEIDIDLRPGVQRICAMTGTHQAEQGCTLRGATFTCFNHVTEQWSRDTHVWKFDGVACRHSGSTEDIPSPDGFPQ